MIAEMSNIFFFSGLSLQHKTLKINTQWLVLPLLPRSICTCTCSQLYKKFYVYFLLILVIQKCDDKLDLFTRFLEFPTLRTKYLLLPRRQVDLFFIIKYNYLPLLVNSTMSEKRFLLLIISFSPLCEM